METSPAAGRQPVTSLVRIGRPKQMKKNFALAALTLTLGLPVVASAQLQSNPPDVTPYNIAIRGGLGFAVLDNSIRDVSNTWINLGLEYTFDKSFIKDSTSYLSVDWFGKSGSGGKGNFFPISLNQRFMLQKPINGYDAYFFVGLGVSVLDIKTTNTVLGARGGVGVDLGPHLFGEAAAYLTTGSDGVHGNIISVAVGYRW